MANLGFATAHQRGRECFEFSVSALPVGSPPLRSFYVTRDDVKPQKRYGYTQ